jgi:hypothetical protein
MPESFRDEQRTLDEGIVPDEPGIIPNKLPLERRKTRGDAKDEKQETSYPMLFRVFEQPLHYAFSSWGEFRFAHGGKVRTDRMMNCAARF